MMHLSVAYNRAVKADRMIEFFDSGDAACAGWSPETIEAARARFVQSRDEAQQVIDAHSSAV